MELGEAYGYRNAQATVLAPTGTIGFMMDCDTTGVEPDIALVKYKKLVGGGLMKIVNQTVPMALKKLGYTPAQVDAVVDYIDKNETIEGAPALKESHLPVFDCAFKAAKGDRSIHYMGHIKMMGADAAVHLGRDQQDRQRAERGDGRRDHAGATSSRGSSAPRRSRSTATAASARSRSTRRGTRRRPRSRSRRPTPHGRRPDAGPSPAAGRAAAPSRTSSTSQGHEGYITVGLFEDGQPGEIFLVMAKEGSTISGFADAFAQAISYALQYGVPLQALVDKFSHVRFEPSGMTRNPEIRFAKSIVDYIFRWLASKFLSPEAQFRAGVNGREAVDDAHAHGEAAPAPRRPLSLRLSSETSLETPSETPRQRIRSRRFRIRKTRRRARPAGRS